MGNELATINNQSPTELAYSIIPRISQAIELARSPEEANELRAKLDTVNTYIKRALPKFIQDRLGQFLVAFKGNKAYLEASAKSGALWHSAENKNPAHRPKSGAATPLLSAIDAGFSDRWDAQKCVKASQVDRQDRELYYDLCLQDSRMPTLAGLVNLWKVDHGGDPDGFQEALKRAIATVKYLLNTANDEQVQIVDNVVCALEDLKEK